MRRDLPPAVTATLLLGTPSHPATTSSTVTYLSYSGHGDLAAETDNAGSRTTSHTYDPFGAPLDTPPANSASHQLM